MKTLDSPRGLLYKTCLISVASIATAAVVGSGAAQAAEFVLGVPMPKKAVSEGPNRFTVPGTLKDAVKFFKKKFKKSPHVFLNAVDHPNAKVVHIRSGDSGTGWEGVNVALYGRKIHVFVIPRGGSLREKAPEEPPVAPRDAAPDAE